MAVESANRRRKRKITKEIKAKFFIEKTFHNLYHGGN